MLADEERGYSELDDEVICKHCVSDKFLVSFIDEHASLTSCSYCRRRSRRYFAVPMSIIQEQIMIGIQSEWGDAAEEGLPYESAEGGWQCYEPLSSMELFDRLGISENENVLEALASADRSDCWVQSDPFQLRDHEKLAFGWSDFKTLVMHQRACPG